MDSNLYLGIAEKHVNRLSFKTFLTWIVVAAIFFFLAKMIWTNWDSVKDAPFRIRPLFLILSSLISAASYFVQMWAWYVTTEKLGIAIPLHQTIETWFYSQLGKYLPGKVWLVLGRFYLYQSRGKSKKAVSIALYFEAATVVIAAGLIFLISLILFKPAGAFNFEHRVFWIGLLSLAALLSLHPRILEKLLNFALQVLRQEPLVLPLSYVQVLWILFICIVAWIVGGIGFYIFVAGVFPVSPVHIPFVMGALAFSSVLGLLALFAPGGLGVREGALVYVLSFLMPSSVAAVISLLTRIWMTLIEMALIGMVYIIGQFQKRYGVSRANPDVQG